MLNIVSRYKNANLSRDETPLHTYTKGVLLVGKPNGRAGWQTALAMSSRLDICLTYDRATPLQIFRREAEKHMSP